MLVFQLDCDENFLVTILNLVLLDTYAVTQSRIWVKRADVSLQPSAVINKKLNKNIFFLRLPKLLSFGDEFKTQPLSEFLASPHAQKIILDTETGSTESPTLYIVFEKELFGYNDGRNSQKFISNLPSSFIKTFKPNFYPLNDNWHFTCTRSGNFSVSIL